MSNKNVALKVNESALIKNIKFAFSNEFSVLMELLQNARRAGATRIEITTEENNGVFSMTMIDNGSGVDDFQKLLTVAESGWDEKILNDEHAFGMGFLSALFSAKRVIVQSNGRTLDMDTEHMISMKDVQIMPVASYTGKGTSVTLHGVNQGVCKNIEGLVAGFPVPVFFNGVELSRNYAVDAMEFEETEIGKVFIDYEGVTSRRGYSSLTGTLFLQGFKVYERFSHYECADYLVHLDSSKFFGRMPDRDKLIDQEKSVEKVSLFIEAKIEKYLDQQLAALGDEQFCEKYGRYVVSNMRSFLNKIKTMIPEGVAGKIEKLSLNNYRMQISGKDSIKRTDLESGKALLFAERYFGDEDCGEEIPMQFIQHHNNAYMLEWNLPDGHWANQFVLEPEADEFSFEVVGCGKTARYSGEYIDTNITLCEEVILTYDKHRVKVRNSAIYAEGNIFVPSETNDSGAGNIVELLSGFYIGDSFDEVGRDKDAYGVARIVRNLLCQNFSSSIVSAIESENIDKIDGIEGKQYIAQFTQKIDRTWQSQNVHVVELSEVFAKLGITATADDVRNAISAIIAEKAQK